MPVTPAPPAKRRDAVASAGLLAALAVSQIGFLGYYDLGGFHTFAPVLVLAALMVALAVAAGAAAPPSRAKRRGRPPRRYSRPPSP